MPRVITIKAGSVELIADLNDSRTAQAIWDTLPISASASTWGDEIYFGIDVHEAEDQARATVDLGDLGYWAPGNAFCIFFGRTPMSRGDEIRPASPVNVVGQVRGDSTLFKQVRSGQKVTITQAAG